MRKLAIVSVVLVAALSAGLSACGPEELDVREETLSRGSAQLISRGVVPRVRGLRFAVPQPQPQAGATVDPSQTGGSGSSADVDFTGGFGALLAGDGASPGGVGSSPTGGVGAPSVGIGGVAGAPASGGVGGVAGGPSTGNGGVAGGPGSVSGGGFGSALANSLCGFMAALCDFIVECVPEAGDAAAEQCGVFATSQCPAMVDQALSAAGGDVPAIPPGAVQVLDCFTSALRTSSCGGDDLEGLGNALSSCDSSALGDFK